MPEKYSDAQKDVFGSGGAQDLLEEMKKNTKCLLALPDEEFAGGDVPVNAKQATGTITFSSSVSDGETVTIGGDVYEFDTGDGVTDGNILVDVSGGATASDASLALATAIDNNATEDVSATDQSGSVDVVCDTPGAQGNDIDTTTDAVNGSWANATLTGGVDGTVTEGAEFRVDGTTLYICTQANTVHGQNWHSISMSQLATS